VLDSQHLRQAVCNAYSAAAEKPTEKHAFPVGRAFAESLGYPPDLLDTLPRASSEAFTGVSNVSLFAEIPESAFVLDLGCGAGLDSLTAAKRVGPKGRVVGIDFSETMLERARCAAVEAGITNVEFRHADAESLPLPDQSVDVALINGIFNLNPARDVILRELARVIRPGGSLFAAELILIEPLSEAVRTSETNWFS